ncbi:MAG: PEP-CTERM sorting domain-containing protein [Betaproteobacteria bacterium]
MARILKGLTTRVAASLLVALATTVDASPYTFTSLDVPGAAASILMDINDSGAAVGIAWPIYPGPVRGGTFAFRYLAGTFAVINAPGAFGVDTIGINNAGHMVGTFYDGKTSRGFLDVEGKFSAIDVPGASATSPTGINSAGQIVGTFTDSHSINHGFLYADGVSTTMDVPGTVFTGRVSINDAGQMVFVSSVSDLYHWQNYLYADGVFSPISGLSPAGAHDIVAMGINNAGQMVGYYNDDTGVHGFLDADRSFTNIDVRPVGSVGGATFPLGLNDRGQIVGYFNLYNGGAPHSFLAPCASDVTCIAMVPEPGSVLLFSAGLLALGLACRRKAAVCA